MEKLKPGEIVYDESTAVGRDRVLPFNPNARQPNESFEDYKRRCRLENKGLKLYHRGRLVWDSSCRGTALRAVVVGDDGRIKPGLYVDLRGNL